MVMGATDSHYCSLTRASPAQCPLSCQRLATCPLPDSHFSVCMDSCHLQSGSSSPGPPSSPWIPQHSLACDTTTPSHLP
jgi:hypothetical protein